jgi:glycosyltransferase involved in cell wall biosynthesis
MASPIVDIIIPTFGRSDRLEAVVADVHAGTDLPHVVSLVVETHDTASVAAARALEQLDPAVRCVINERGQNYAGAINTAVGSSITPYWFAGADDLRFHPGWFTAAARLIDDRFWVIGTNDLLNCFVLDGLHATHYLVDRRYTDELGGTIDEGPGIAMHEGYDHNWTDTEFIGVAKARVRFRPCLDSVVEHMHHLVGKAPKDDTYRRGTRNMSADQALYLERKQAWDNLVA